MILRQLLAFGLLLAAPTASAAEPTYSGPFWMCPDAHGADQISQFKTIDITKFPMRIDSMGSLTIEGVEAQVHASRSAAIMNNGGDPIEQAYKKLFGDFGNIMGTGKNRQLAALCFAVQPPPKNNDEDGPFVFMPGFLLKSGESPDSHLDSIQVPSHLYFVLSYTGTQDDIGNMRFTLTSEFFPKFGPVLGFRRDERAPNIMLWNADEGGNESIQHLEMWTPILPVSVNQAVPWKMPPLPDGAK